MKILDNLIVTYLLLQFTEAKCVETRGALSKRRVEIHPKTEERITLTQIEKECEESMRKQLRENQHKKQVQFALVCKRSDAPTTVDGTTSMEAKNLENNSESKPAANITVEEKSNKSSSKFDNNIIAGASPMKESSDSEMKDIKLLNLFWDELNKDKGCSGEIEPLTKTIKEMARKLAINATKDSEKSSYQLEDAKRLFARIRHFEEEIRNDKEASNLKTKTVSITKEGGSSDNNKKLSKGESGKAVKKTSSSGAQGFLSNDDILLSPNLIQPNHYLSNDYKSFVQLIERILTAMGESTPASSGLLKDIRRRFAETKNETDLTMLSSLAKEPSSENKRIARNIDNKFDSQLDDSDDRISTDSVSVKRLEISAKDLLKKLNDFLSTLQTEEQDLPEEQEDEIMAKRSKISLSDDCFKDDTSDDPIESFKRFQTNPRDSKKSKGISRTLRYRPMSGVVSKIRSRFLRRFHPETRAARVKKSFAEIPGEQSDQEQYSYVVNPLQYEEGWKSNIGQAHDDTSISNYPLNLPPIKNSSSGFNVFRVTDEFQKSQRRKMEKFRMHSNLAQAPSSESSITPNEKITQDTNQPDNSRPEKYRMPPQQQQQYNKQKKKHPYRPMRLYRSIFKLFHPSKTNSSTVSETTELGFVVNSESHATDKVNSSTCLGTTLSVVDDENVSEAIEENATPE